MPDDHAKKPKKPKKSVPPEVIAATSGPARVPDGAPLRKAYQAVKTAAASDWAGDTCNRAIRELVLLSLEFLAEDGMPVPCKSLVPGKEYFAFARKDAPSLLSRPVNSALFIVSAEEVAAQWDDWLAGELAPEDLAKMSYTVAVSPCVVMELFDRQNKKGPATYFECLVGHIFANEIGINPRKKAALPVGKRSVRMTMDFIFDGNKSRANIHLAAKMSTRERVVQAWAHQRLLDKAFGDGEYKGIMVLFAETKLDLKKREVVEICVPDQWLAYQTYLARIDRIYYFDVPSRYQQLADEHPDLIPMKQFGSLFIEKEALFDDGGEGDV